MTSNDRIGLFVTCLVDLFRPSVGLAAVRLLEQAGHQVEVPALQTCCGQPAYNSGDRDSTIAIAKQVIDAFAAYPIVIVPSGSCAATIKLHYPKLFEDDAEWYERAMDLSGRCHELLSFLSEVTDQLNIDAGYAQRVSYHDSCSGLRELGVKQQPRTLLRQVKGLELVEMQDSEVCCGFGGTFCVKYPAISERMVSDKVHNLEQTGADSLLGGDLGCLLNIAGRLRRLGKSTKVFHAAEVLAGMTRDKSIAEGD